MENIAFDKEALKQYLRQNGVNQKELSRRIGRGDNYISSLIYTGKAPKCVWPVILREIGAPPSSFALAEKPKEAPKSSMTGWNLTLRCRPGAVNVTVSFDDSEVASGWGRIKEETDLGLVQAISYAAHMCYKKVEERTMME